MVSSPGISRTITEFEKNSFIGLGMTYEVDIIKIHEHSSTCLKKIPNVKCHNEEGNPSEGSQLISIGIRNVVVSKEPETAAPGAYLNGCKQA
ncbi:hypothetical protein AVEN_107870-1 [Araneus ventricosus]|uniref:Uncharacterized protein n=1 Tax=Araneus ventricosus TaxID=182803 RepID=A0A4Y2R5W1_ARAVE|nr:hypothetical protein AVEN_107870-1 [Araneus ventricosus]